MIAFLGEAKAAKEVPGTTVLLAGHRSDAAAAKLDERIAKDARDRLTRGPARRCRHEGDLDVGVVVVVEERGGDEILATHDADALVRRVELSAQLKADPLREQIVVIDEHQICFALSITRSVRIQTRVVVALTVS